MGKIKKEDRLAEYELDWTDPFTEDLVQYVSKASGKLYDGLQDGKSPSSAFNEFVSAWDFYYFMPEDSQTKSKKLMEAFLEMWEYVIQSKINEFCDKCAEAVQDSVNTDSSIIDMCGELNEAIFAVGGQIPEAPRIFDAAHNLATHGTFLSNACIAQLYILCARVWYNCLGYPCGEEEKLLSEGIKHHILAKAQGKAPKTELYSLHIATAIYDATCVQLKNGAAKEEITDQVLEAYNLLSSLESPTAFKEIEDLYQMTGIPYDDTLITIHSWKSLVDNDKNSSLPN